MSIKDLTAALVADVETEAAAIRDDARAQAARIAADASAERRAQLDDELTKLRTVHEAETYGRVAEKTRRLRVEELCERAAMLDRVRAKVFAMLPELLADAELRDTLIDNALSVAGARAVAVRCTPTLVDQVRARSTSAVEVVADPAVGNGLVIALEGGRSTVIVTLESELDRLWPTLQIEALATLDIEESA